MQMKPNAEPRSSRFQWGLGLLISILVIIWAIWALDWGSVGHALLQLHYGWIVLALVLNLLSFWTRTSRWALLLRPGRFQPFNLLTALIIGQTANYLSPARIGDLLRAYLFGQTTGGSKARALGTIALEKIWDLLMLLLFALIVGWFFPLPEWLVGPMRGLLLLTVVLLTGLGLVLWRQEQALDFFSTLTTRFLPGWGERLVQLVKNILRGFTGLQNWQIALRIGFWSLLTWLLGVLLNYAVFLAFDLSLSLIPASLLMIALMAGIAVPSLPGRIGVFQGICVIVLALFGISEDLAFSYGLILHLVVFLPPIVLAAFFSFRLKINWRQFYTFNYEQND